MGSPIGKRRVMMEGSFSDGETLVKDLRFTHRVPLNLNCSWQRMSLASASLLDGLNPQRFFSPCFVVMSKGIRIQD